MLTVKEALLEEIQEIHLQIPEFSSDYLLKNAPSHFTNEHYLLAGYIDGKPAGYLIGYDSYHDGSFYCWMTAVMPSFRNKGLLKAMMANLNQWATEHGYSHISIKTRNDRREMLSFLVKEGFNFTHVEERENSSDNRISLIRELLTPIR